MLVGYKYLVEHGRIRRDGCCEVLLQEVEIYRKLLHDAAQLVIVLLGVHIHSP